jgi:hypothetical protein
VPTGVSLTLLVSRNASFTMALSPIRSSSGAVIGTLVTASGAIEEASSCPMLSRATEENA